MYSPIALVSASVWETSLPWWLLWIVMAAVVCFIINRSRQGGGS